MRTGARALAALALLLAACAPEPSGDRALAEAALARAESALAGGRRRDALPDLKQAVAEAPDWAEAHRRLAEVAHSLDDQHAAIASYQFLLGEEGETAARADDLARDLADAALIAGRPDVAREALDRLEASQPDDPGTQLLLARWAFETGDLAAAGAAAERVLRRRPRSTVALHLGGVALEERDPARAELYYGRALVTDPGHQGARSRLALLLAQRGEREEAELHRDLHRRIAAATARHYRMRPPEQRLEEFGVLAEELPGWELPRVEQAQALLDLGRPSEASALLKSALRNGLDGPRLRLTLADALRQMGKPRAAEKHEAMAVALQREQQLSAGSTRDGERRVPGAQGSQQ